MHSVQYVVGGHVPVEHSDLYVYRAADAHARSQLERVPPGFVLLFSPRQQGKTSLIFRLLHDLQPLDYRFAYLDISLAAPDESTWYRQCWIDLRNPDKSSLAELISPHPPQNGSEWHQCLLDLAAKAEAQGIRPVIAVDEIGKRFAWTNDFYSAIRKLYGISGTTTHSRYLSFVLAGACDPAALIDDPAISPFNVSPKVDLQDFTVSEVGKLVGLLGLPAEQTRRLTRAIYHWTNGQPYLTQLLCRDIAVGYLAASETAIAEAAIKLAHTESTHIGSMLHRLKQHENKHLIASIDRVRQYSAVLWSDPTWSIDTPPKQRRRTRESTPDVTLGETYDHAIHGDLALIGLVKCAHSGKCVIRNRMYLEAIRHLRFGSSSEAQRGDIERQLERLKKLRRNLHNLQDQAAHYSKASIPLHILNDLADTRAQIQPIKQYLRKHGVPVDDVPGEDESTDV